MVAKTSMICVMAFTAIVHSAHRSVPRVDVYKNNPATMPGKRVMLITGAEVNMPAAVNTAKLRKILLDEENTPDQKTLAFMVDFFAEPSSKQHRLSPQYVAGMDWLYEINDKARLPHSRDGAERIIPSYFEQIIVAAIGVRLSPGNASREFVMRDPFAKACAIPPSKNGTQYEQYESSEQRGEQPRQNKQYNKDDGLIFEIEI